MVSVTVQSEGKQGIVLPIGAESGSSDSVERAQLIADGVQRIVLWSQSRRVLQGSMEATGFPLRGDESAFRLLTEVIRRGPLRPAELAEILSTGRANVSKIVARLESIGLVQRRTNAADTRSVFVELTPSGLAFANEFAATGRRFYDLLFSAWSEPDVDALERLLPRLAEDLETLTAVRLSSS
ncbi:MarR family winged helix-turn-helix transcriptional regulator [Agromyces bracchium]|uniref:MarR family transcriptional regulator n=1 Tax=Agromyces bracchium TaxID=88376 RepID=A0A6I3M7Y4_9MICO|nr:MarR family transcriptional regulator [Agromyces bracchium]MTH69454.1 MarR family transcriptional regulator [Agromyces bracchium]